MEAPGSSNGLLHTGADRFAGGRRAPKLDQMAGVARDYSDLAHELEEMREQQRAISGVLRAVARRAGLQPVLEEVAEACRRLCEADHGALWLLEDGLLHVGAHHGEPEAAQYDLDHPHPVDRTTAAGRAAIERKPVQIPDVLTDPEYTYPGPRFFRTMLGVPIMVEDDLIGVVVLVRREQKPFTDDHIALVQTFADQAAIALTNARLLDAVERQRTELSRFVSPQISNLITSEDGDSLLAGHRAYISSLFSDLRGFTAFAETAAPEDLFDVLREYHAVLGELISAHQGTLEHFAGDGLMVFFNDPLPVDEHELQAVRLALAAQARFGELAAGWRKRGIDLALGIGIEAGYATLGRIGFEGRFDYAAVGPAMNLASRLCAHASPGQTLIGQRVFAATEEAVETRPVGSLELKGFGRPVTAYEVRRLR
jgi:class 3 adenylate cyclase/putative methionine-R-sulfoxide reductase with GAF domain